jgi:hypothetical protein
LSRSTVILAVGVFGTVVPKQAQYVATAFTFSVAPGELGTFNKNRYRKWFLSSLEGKSVGYRGELGWANIC